MYKLSNRSISNLNGTKKWVLPLVMEAVKYSPYDFGIPSTGGFRTAEVQHALFLDKKSNCDGYEKKSRHQYGDAFDIFAYVDGKASWDEKYLMPIARHIQRVAIESFGIELEWGGEFLTKSQKRRSKSHQNLFKILGKGWDKPHFQRKIR